MAAHEYYIAGRTEIHATNQAEKLVPEGMQGRLLLYAESGNAAVVRDGIIACMV